jgi:ribosomal protein S4
VAGLLGDFLKARRAIRQGRVRVAGVVVFDPSAQVNPLAVVVADG